MSCRCPYCMSELDINKIKYYVKVENEPSQPKLKAFLAVNREDRHFYNFWSRYNRKLVNSLSLLPSARVTRLLVLTTAT